MKIENLKKNILFYFLTFILFVTIVCSVVFISIGNTFILDDYGYSTYDINEKLFDCFKFNFMHGGGYLGFFFSKFFSFYLPNNILNIHPEDTTGYIHGTIKGIFTAIIIFLISKFSTFFNKSKILYISSIVFIITYIFSAIIDTETWVFLISYNFYRYLFSLLFISLFWYYIYENILITYKKINYHKLFFICVCGFIIGTSIELAFFSSLFLCCSIILYHIVINFISKFKSKNINSFKFKINKTFLLPFISLSLGTYLFVSSPGFKEVSTDRGLATINITIPMLLEFINSYVEICFMNNLNYWIVLIILICTSFYFAIKKQEIKKVIFPLLITFSILVVMFSLILCGKTNGGKFYIYHLNVLFHYKMQLLFPLLIYFGYSFKNILLLLKNIIIRQVLSYILIIIITFSSFYIIKNNQETFLNINKELKEDSKQKMYMYEKIARFYYLQNEVPKLPFDIFNFDYSIYYVEDKSQICANKTCFTHSWYPLIYRNNISQELGFCLDNNAFNKFYEKGGTFTDEELKELKFERLKDEDFVLNKKEVI